MPLDHLRQMLLAVAEKPDVLAALANPTSVKILLEIISVSSGVVFGLLTGILTKAFGGSAGAAFGAGVGALIGVGGMCLTIVNSLSP